MGEKWPKMIKLESQVSGKNVLYTTHSDDPNGQIYFCKVDCLLVLIF